MPVLAKMPTSVTGKASVKANVGTSTRANLRANDEAKVCWIEVKRYPYQPDHQVELLHLQAEADALIIKLQASGQKQLAEKSRLASK